MKISFLIPSLRAGGAERQFLILAEELAKRGYLVNFIIYKSEELFYHPNNVEAVYIPKKHKIDFLFLKRLVGYVKQNNIDILFSCYEARGIFEPPLLWARLVKLFHVNVRIISGYMSSHLSKSQIVVEGLTNNLSSLMIANNNYVLGLLKDKVKIGADKLVCIRNIAATDRFFPLPKEKTEELRFSYLNKNKDKFVCGIIGSYTPVKNHILLIQAMKLLKDKDSLKDFYFLAYGDETCKGSQFRKLKRMVESKGLANWTSLNSTEKDVNHLINSLDTLIVPSLYEGAPNVVMEALMCGKPVIISKSANRAGFITDGRNGLVFERNDYRHLAECILRMKYNPIRIRESFLKRFLLQHDKDEILDKYISCFAIVTGNETEGGGDSGDQK